MRFEEYVRFDALGLAELVSSGQVSAAELLETAITRAEAVNPKLNAVVRRFDERARKQLSEPLSGSFAGVPFLIKDLMAAYAGETLSGGSRLFAGYVPAQDSELVRRYKAAGLVIWAKTNTPEFGLTPFTEPELFGPARNPWNTAHTPGGSSGGSGAAVAAGIVPMANGGDGGGSLRIPASCNGLVGLKPTRGLLPLGPELGESWWGFATEHVITRSLRDSAAALDATAGPDPGCPYFTRPGAGYLAALDQPVPRLRIAFSAAPLVGRSMHAECRQGLEASVRLLESLGHEVVEAAPQVSRDAFIQSFVTLLAADTAGMVTARLRAIGSSDLGLVEPSTRALVHIGRALSGEEVVLARTHFHQLARQIGRWFEDYDILLTPTLGLPPFRIGALQPSVAEKLQIGLLNHLPIARLIKSGSMLQQVAEKTFEWMPNTAVFNVTGQPSISLPLHWSADGLPVGMMFTGRFDDDARLLQLAAQIEQAQPWFERRPPI